MSTTNTPPVTVDATDTVQYAWTEATTIDARYFSALERIAAAAERIADAVACSPLGKGRPRPEIECRPVVIEDDVWIGPNATILKGVRIGTGAFIEAGSLVTRDVPAGARVLGNPAVVVGEMP